MRNIKARYIWLAVLVLLAAAAGLIIWITRGDSSLATPLTIVLVIVFVVITFLIQFASFRTFSGRQKRKIKYPTKEYRLQNNFEEEYKKLGYERTNRGYGYSYLKIKNKVAYKISIIDSIDIYYNNEEKKDTKTNKELDKCNIFIGVEIFKEVNKEALDKIPDYSFQVEKIYYTAWVLKEDGNYKCFNYVEPDEKHNEAYLNLVADLSAEEVI